ELLLEGERSSGQIVDAVGEEFGISQPAISQHLRVLREHGFATVRPEGTRRMYAVEASGMRDVDAWVQRFRDVWSRHLDALGTELARGRRAAAERRTDPDEPKESDDVRPVAGA